MKFDLFWIISVQRDTARRFNGANRDEDCLKCSFSLLGIHFSASPHSLQIYILKDPQSPEGQPGP